MQLGMGSAILLLTACGGGGGDSLVEDDGSGDDGTARLRRAFDQLQPGMTTEDVINVVGRPPDNNAISELTWQALGGSLIVTFDGGSRDGLRIISAAGWLSAQERRDRSFL